MRIRRGLFTFIVAAVTVLLLGTCGAAEEVAQPPTPTTAPAGQPKAPAPAATAAPAAPAAPASTAVPAATAVSAPAATKYGGTLRVRVGADAKTLDPLQSTAYPDWPQMTPMFEGLTRIDAQNNILPALAESWDGSSGDIVFKVRKNAKFHDGTPVNAKAVKFNLDRYLDPELKSRGLTFLKNVSGVEIVDSHTVKFVMKGPDVLVLKYLATPNGGFLSSPAAVMSMSLADYNRNPVAASAFKLTDWRSDSAATYEKFDDYWNPELPYLDGFVVRVISDSSVAIAALRAGEIDLYPSPTATDWKRLNTEEGIVTTRRTCQCYVPSLEPHREQGGPLGDVNIRKALSMAIDRVAVAEALFAGLATPVYGPISPGFTGAFRPDMKKYSYDPAGAKKLITEAGFPDGFDITISTYVARKARAEAIAAMWTKVGVNATIDVRDFATVSYQCQVEWDCEFYLTGYGSHLDPDFPMRDRYYPGARKNIGNTQFKGADGTVYAEILDKALANFDSASRAIQLQQAEDILVENMASIWVASTDLLNAWHVSVKDYTPNPSNLSYYNEIWLDK